MLAKTLLAGRAVRHARCASSLRDVLAAQLPQKQAELKELKAQHGDKVVGTASKFGAHGGDLFKQ